jgi:prevent-host-death family protein
MARHAWTVTEARSNLAELLDRVRSQGPQAITRNGRKVAVVVAIEDWKRKTLRVGNLAQFLAASPLRGSGLKLRRRTDRPRRIAL